MSLNYTTYTNQLANLMVDTSTSPNFVTFLPGCIDYAEQRIYRELDLMTTRQGITVPLSTSGDNNLTLPTSAFTFLVVERINVITPVGTTMPGGTRNPLTFVSPEFIAAAFPSDASSNSGVPRYVSRVSDSAVTIGPFPDAAYTAEINGTIRPTSLSAANSSTFLTQSLPDLFMAASMVFATAYQRDFGAMVDDPARAASWESQYKLLKESANTEELRKRFMGPAWQAMTPAPQATPPRQ